MKAPVYYNHGRWVVDCPRKTCASAALAPKDRKRITCICGDVEVCDHKTPCNARMDLIWPELPDAIVEMVSKRPRGNRNWYPGETLADLHAENLAHGVGV